MSPTRLRFAVVVLTAAAAGRPAWAQDAGPDAAPEPVPIEETEVEPAEEPEPEPEPDPETPITDVPEAGAVPDVSTAVPRTLSRYEIEGALLESEKVLRGFLDQAMPIGNVWDDDTQLEVVEFCEDLGYHVGIRSETEGTTGVVAYLNLQPITLVRRIKVSVDGNFVHQIIQDKIFEKDIKRRLRLKVGRALPIDETTRLERLREEIARIQDYLADEGFFEAEVKINPVPDGPHAIKLLVDIVLGPPYYVGNVRVVGNTAISDEEIQDLFFHKRLSLPLIGGGWTRRFDRDQLKKDIDRVVELYQKRGFPGVRVRTDFDRNTSFKRNRAEVDFTVIVRERRRIEVYFEGNDAKTEGRLREELTFDEEGSYDDFEVQRSAQAIRRFYQSQGYFEASVLWERVSFRIPGRLFDRIVFTIDEGPKLKVRRIQFSGNEVITDATLRDLIKTREYPRFFLVSGGYASSVQLEQDIQRIVGAYRAKGYANVQVHYEATRDDRLIGSAPALAAAILSDLSADGLYIRFIVDEGDPLRIADVRYEFVGSHRKTADDLSPITTLGRGSAYTPADADADGDSIQRYYFRNAFPYARVRTCTPSTVIDPEKEPDLEQQGLGCPDPKSLRDDAGRITILHKIKEGRPVVFGKVALRGNFKTSDWVIREELRLPEGAPFTLGRAERAQRNLRTSGLFSNVRFRYVGLEDDRHDTINVVLHVQERYDYWFDYQVAAGGSTDEGLFLEGNATVPNMWGIGARMSMTGTIGTERQRAEGRLLLPRWIQRHLLGLAFRTEADIFWQNEVTPRFGDLTSFGGSIGAGIEGTPGGSWDGWFLGMRYVFRQRNREEDLVRTAGASDDIEQTRVKTRTGSIGPRLVLDKRTDSQGRRNPLAPEAGFRIELSALFADEALGGDDRFVKLGFKGLHYWKLGSRFLVTNGVRYDHGIPLGGAVVLPEVERYFAGGDTTVRGFEEDRLFTEVIEEDVPPLGGLTQIKVLPAGGNIRMIHNLELQVQVWDRSFVANLPWASALFLDTGIVTNSLDGVQIDQLRHSLGIAFWRLVTPVGSFSFEWAVPLDPQFGDNPRGRLHLNLGFVFK